MSLYRKFQFVITFCFYFSGPSYFSAFNQWWPIVPFYGEFMIHLPLWVKPYALFSHAAKTADFTWLTVKRQIVPLLKYFVLTRTVWLIDINFRITIMLMSQIYQEWLVDSRRKALALDLRLMNPLRLRPQPQKWVNLILRLFEKMKFLIEAQKQIVYKKICKLYISGWTALCWPWRFGWGSRRRGRSNFFSTQSYAYGCRTVCRLHSM